ncbi:concanavalin A-like lectin/glucanase domain-containing protein, partial [Phialemonium atrogriseum]
YNVKWSGNGSLVCGKGWNPGGPRLFKAVNYTGTYEPTGPGYLSVCGWTRNALVECYIVESHDNLSPDEVRTRKGNFTFDEGAYQMYESTRVQRVAGAVTTGRQYGELSKVGMKFGSHDYTIVATKG